MAHQKSIHQTAARGAGRRPVSRWHVVFVVAIASMVVAGISTTSATTRFQIATAEEVITGLVSPGTVDCIGGDAADPPVLCTPDTKRIHLRNLVQTAEYVALAGEAAALIDGTNTIVINCNLDASLQGQCWGTSSWAIPLQGGTWEGSWTGHFDLVNRLSSYTAVGRGSGGTLDGLQITVDAVNAGGNPTLVVRILSPGR